jgi:hypothetical protein
LKENCDNFTSITKVSELKTKFRYITKYLARLMLRLNDILYRKLIIYKMSDIEADYGDDWASDDETKGDFKDNEQGEEDVPDWYRPPQQPQVVAAYEDIERTQGGGITCWETGIDGQPLKVQTPLGRFCLYVNSVGRQLEVEKCIKPQDINHLLEKAQQIERVPYLNPTAFVLGYMASAGGTKSVSKVSLNQAWKCYEQLDYPKDESVFKPDIIRYARYWKTLVK